MSVEPVDVVVREAPVNNQLTATVPTPDLVTVWVQVKEDIGVPALSDTAAAALTQSLTAEPRCCGDVEDVWVHHLVQVEPCVET